MSLLKFGFKYPRKIKIEILFSLHKNNLISWDLSNSLPFPDYHLSGVGNLKKFKEFLEWLKNYYPKAEIELIPKPINEVENWEEVLKV